MNIGILGAGSWAIALAVLFDSREHRVTLWEYDLKEAELLQNRREHPVKLPGVHIPLSISITSDLNTLFDSLDMVVVAVPTQFVRQTMRAISAAVDPSQIAKPAAWTIVSKGIEIGSNSLLAEVVKQELSVGDDKLAVLSGPSHAEEVGKGVPTTVVAASVNADLALSIQENLSTENFRIYTNNDITGVELAGSVKNVIALAAGICDGLGFGDNTKGALLTRGMVEMARLGKAMGACEHTFSGLAGFGDLVTTCFSAHSRNRKMGEILATGCSLDEALGQMTMVAEGVTTAKSLYSLSLEKGIDMPITTQIYEVIYNGKSPKEAVKELMQRESRPERY